MGLERIGRRDGKGRSEERVGVGWACFTYVGGSERGERWNGIDLVREVRLGFVGMDTYRYSTEYAGWSQIRTMYHNYHIHHAYMAQYPSLTFSLYTLPSSFCLHVLLLHLLPVPLSSPSHPFPIPSPIPSPTPAIHHSRGSAPVAHAHASPRVASPFCVRRRPRVHGRTGRTEQIGQREARALRRSMYRVAPRARACCVVRCGAGDGLKGGARERVVSAVGRGRAFGWWDRGGATGDGDGDGEWVGWRAVGGNGWPRARGERWWLEAGLVR